MKSKLYIATFLMALLATFLYTQDLKQRNPESIFLTDSGIEKFNQFQKDFPEAKSLIVYTNLDASISNYQKLEALGEKIEGICESECYVVYPHQLYKDREDFDKRLDQGKLISHRLISNSIMGISIFSTSDSNVLHKVIELVVSMPLFHCAGHDYTNYRLDISSALVQKRLFPIMFVASFLLILIFVRSFKDALLLFLPSLLSALISLSVIKFFFITMNMVTSIVPLMTFVITLSLGQHLYFTAKELGGFKLACINKFKPVALMLLTTFVGFLSLYTSEIYVIRVFGTLCAILIAISCGISILWFLCIDQYSVFKKGERFVIAKYPKRTLSGIGIILLTIISGAVGVIGFYNVQIVTDATQYFPKQDDITHSFSDVQKITGGVPIFEIGLPSDKDGFNFELHKKAYEIEKRLKEIDDIKVISQNQIIESINQSYTSAPNIPDNHFAYTALFSRAPEGIRESYPIDQRGYKITILGKPVNVDSYDELLAKVKSVMGNSEYEIDGLYYNLMISQREMVHTLSKSFLLSLIIMTIIAVIALRNLRLFVIFTVVNTLPLGLSLGFLYFFDMSLNIATVMTYSVGLGIVVDSTFHLLHYLKEEHFKAKTYIETIVKPILTSSFTLILAFSLFGFYDFLPIKEFGLNLAFILLCGMIFDLFVLPTLYLGNSKFKKVKYENL